MRAAAGPKNHCGSLTIDVLSSRCQGAGWFRVACIRGTASLSMLVRRPSAVSMIRMFPHDVFFFKGFALESLFDGRRSRIRRGFQGLTSLLGNVKSSGGTGRVCLGRRGKPLSPVAATKPRTPWQGGGSQGAG